MVGSYFSDLMGRAVPAMMRAFARFVTSYEAADGTTTADVVIYCGAVSTTPEETDTGSIVTVRRRPFSVLKDEQNDAFKGVAIVQMGGKFVIDGMTWQVEDFRAEEDYAVSGSLVNRRERRKAAPGTFKN